MVSLPALWLPILVSAAIVFIASSLIHMLLGYHRNDVRAFPDEARLLEALRSLAIPPGDYHAPFARSMQQMKSPEFLERRRAGPIVNATILAGGSVSMGRSLLQWFVYAVVVSVFAGYVASRAVGPGADYLRVFRFSGAVAFAGYSLALAQNSIWWGRNWAATARSMFDGLIYGLLTAGVFGWLWPR